MSPIPTQKVLAKKIKQKTPLELVTPVVLKPITYTDHVPEVLKYHSSTSKTIHHPKPNVAPIKNPPTNPNVFRSSFNCAFESFLNKPSNSTTLFSFSVSLSVYFFFTSIFDRSISTSHVSTGQPESAALNSSIKHNLRRQKITKENEDKGRKATD